MKILHTATLNKTTGGPAMSTYLTLKGLVKQGVQAEVFCPPFVNESINSEAVAIHNCQQPLKTKFAYSPTYKKEMEALGNYDIYHAQGIWQYPTYALVDVARKKGKPYVITPRGMLYPQDIAKSNRFFKRLSLKLRLLRDLNQAACIHVTCQEEMKHCRELGITSPIAVIPNPIEIKEYPYQKQDDIFRIGYLGRLSPRKNVEGLIYALAAQKDQSNIELLIIGGGDSVYESFLKEEVKRLNLKNVRFTGFLSGEEKDKALASLSVLAMPSEFENLGNVILEGLVRGIPCIATQGAPWEELNTHQCGWWIEYNQEALNHTLEKAIYTPVEELRTMGVRGRKLMEDSYSIESISLKMKQMYQWIMSFQGKPEFVNMLSTSLDYK